MQLPALRAPKVLGKVNHVQAGFRCKNAAAALLHDAACICGNADQSAAQERP